MELFFVVKLVLNFGRKFIKNLNTHIMDALLEFGHPCWWRVQFTNFTTAVHPRESEILFTALCISNNYAKKYHMYW